MSHHANFPGGPSWAVEARPGSGPGVERVYAQKPEILQVTKLPHFSSLLERDIYLVWGDLKLRDLYVQDVLMVEGGIALLYNGPKVPPPPLLPPLRPDQYLALALQRVPVQLRSRVEQALGARYEAFIRAQDVPVKVSLRAELPFGAPGLFVGDEVSENRFQEDGSLQRILEMIGAPAAWEHGTGEGMTIAIIDDGCSGVPLEKRDHSWTNITKGDPWKSDGGHGGMVARIAMAVAPGAKIASHKPAGDDRGVMSSSSIYMSADALLEHFLARNHEQGHEQGHEHLSFSWGVAGCQSVWLPGNVLGARVLKKVDEKGWATLAWAFGNSRHVCGNSRVSGYTLASIPSALGVGALDMQGRPQFYTSLGPGAVFPFQPAVSCPTGGVLPWGDGYRDFKTQGGGTVHALRW